MSERSKELLSRIFDAAIAAADAFGPTRAALPPPPAGRTLVLGAGKAAVPMARAVESAWPGAVEGFVVVPHGYEGALGSIEILAAGHPVPDKASESAARRMLEMAGELEAQDMLLLLVSGGASALLAAPVEEISLKQKAQFTENLLRSGRNIREVNAIRRELSEIKGGGLWRAALPAQVVNLLVSDVVGDDPAFIGGAPGIPPANMDAYEENLSSFDFSSLPSNIKRIIERERMGRQPLATGSPARRIVLRGADMLAGAGEAARTLGLEVVDLGDAIEGEALSLARDMAQRTRRLGNDPDMRKPIVMISGGEATVTHAGGGRGGPNSEFALAFALATEGIEDVAVLAADSDGIDGTGPHAGVLTSNESVAAARERGLDPEAALRAHDSATFFESTGELIITGPTHTNVSDFRAILIGA